MSNFKKILINVFIKIFIRIFRRKAIDKKIYFYDNAEILLLQFHDKQEALNLTPLIKVIKENYNCEITPLCSSNNHEIFANNELVNNILICEHGIKFLTKTIFKLRNNKYDIIIDCHESVNIKSTLAIGLLRSRNKVGFITEHSSLLTHRIPLLNAQTNHIIDRLLHLTDALEIKFSKSDLNIYYNTTKKSHERIRDYFITHNLEYKMTAVINISNKASLGFWGFDNYRNLIKYLRNYDINVIIAAAIDDIELAEKIADNKYLIFYNTDFDIYAEFLKNVNFVFSPDSFTIQLAGAFKVPVFCLFVQDKNSGMINVPYNSDFDFVSTDKKDISSISFGQTLNSFVPYFEYLYERYRLNK